MPWDGRRVPLTLLGGYLGSGKTTLINELLARSDRPIAILVNDVGAINVDAALIRRRNRDTIEFTEGCVCCSLSDGLGRAFDQLRLRDIPPEHVILELSGLANPDRVRPWGKSAGFRLDGVVILVDCEQFFELNTNPVVGTVLRTQITSADLLVLTKTDLVAPKVRQTVFDQLTVLAPATPIIDSSTALASAGILELGANSPDQIQDIPPPTLFDQHRVQTLPLPSPISQSDLQILLDELPADTLRAKGIAQAPDGTRLLIQVVGRRRVITALSSAELAGPGGLPAPTQLVVISPSDEQTPDLTGLMN